MKSYRCSECNYPFPNVPDEWTPKACPFCQGVLMLDEPAENWMNDIYSDDRLWYVDGFRYFPSIIAHEYWRLRDMFQEGQPYGVYFQIRDLAETVLKFEILSICAWADAMQIQGYQKQVCCLITTRGMSLGAWYEVARRIQGFFRNSNGGQALPVVFSAALDGIIREYGDASVYVRRHKGAKSMLNWRNEKIGHGALGFADDEAFRADIRVMIEYFKALFETMVGNSTLTVGEALIQQTLWLNDKALRGYESARGASEAEGELKIRIENGDTAFPISPYVVYDNGCVFFFDNQKSQDRTQQQCYMNGYRKNEDIPFFTQLLRMNTRADLESDVAAQTRIKAEDDLLNRLSVAPKYIKPQHLVEWLKKQLSAHERGVFYLRMPRGSGKSTFAEKLNCLYEKPTRIAEDVDARTYHISRTQMINARDFARHIEEEWRHDYENQTEWTGYTQISEYLASGMKPAQALACYLGDCLAFTRRVRGKARILMVIDGLDEITESALWEYMPTPELLDAGVYVLLTSRDPDKEALPENVTAALSGISATQTLTVDVEGAGNIAFLNDYVREYIDKDKRAHMKPDAVNTLLRHGEHRVLYVGLLCKLVSAGMPIDTLPGAENLVERYLEILSLSYGEKETLRLRELLSVLCAIGADEPLSMRELAGLLNNGLLSLSLLGQMQDIAPLLKAQRGYQADGRWYAGENRYEPANPELAEALKAQIPEWKSVVRELFEDACATAREEKGHEDREDGETNPTLLTLAHAKVCGGLQLDRENIEETLNDLHKFIQHFYMDSHIRAMERTLSAQTCVMQAYEALDAAGKLRDPYNLEELCMNMTMILGRLSRYEEMLTRLNRARDLLEAQKAEGKLNYRGNLSTVYSDTLFALNGLSRYDEALALGQRERAFLEKLDAAGQLHDRALLANLLINLADTLAHLSRFDEALELERRACAIMEKLDAAGQLRDRDDLVNAYRFIASTLDDLNRLDEALEYYNRACAMGEAMDSAGELRDRDELAEVYMHMAITLRRLTRYDEALDFYERALAIQEALDAAGQLPDRSRLARVCINMGVTLNCLKRHEAALAQYERARPILETLYAEGRLYERNLFASLYFGKASTLLDLSRHEEALALYDRAREIWETPDASGQLYNLDNLAKAYVSMARTLELLDRQEEGLPLYDRAREICEALDRGGQVYDHELLKHAYDRMIDILKKLNRRDEVMALYERKQALLENWYADGKLSYEDLATCYADMAKEIDEGGSTSDHIELAQKYWNMASTEEAKNNYSEALKYYARARACLETLDVADALSPRDSLAAVYIRMANALLQLTRYDEALTLFERARSFFEALDATGELGNRGVLMELYAKMEFTLAQLSRYDEELELLEHMRQILEAQDAAGELHDRSKLAKVYANMVFSLSNLNRYEEALSMDYRALSIGEEMDAAGLVDNRNELANMYHNTANLLMLLNRWDEGLDMFDRARTILEAMDADGALSDRNGLASICIETGIALMLMKQNEEALEVFSRARTIQEAMDEAGQLPDRNELATVYMYVAIALGNLKRFDEALEMFDRARHIKEDLDAAGQLSDRNELAYIYELMAVLFLEQDMPFEALSAYIKIVNLTNELKNSGKPFDSERLDGAMASIAEIKRKLSILVNDSIGDGNSYDIEFPDWAFENVMDLMDQEDTDESE